MQTSDVIASLSSIVSLGTLAWTYFKDKKDQAALQEAVNIANELDHYGCRTKGPDIFSLNMVNTGTRRIYLRGWYRRTTEPEHHRAFLQNQKTPEYLEPGAHHTALVPGVTILHDSITSIYVSDSKEKDWPIKKDNLKNLLANASEIARQSDLARVTT